MVMAFILKRVESPSKEEIKDLIAENCILLDKQLEVVGGIIGTREVGMWDLVGVDKDKRMVLIGVELQYTYKMLYHIVNRLDWAWENIDIITRMYPSCGIDSNQTPRAIIIAPSYSQSFKKIITYLDYLKINLFTYTYLESDAGKGILLEPVEIQVKYEHVPKIDNKNMESVDVSPITKVTTEEIMEFLH
jgi:hypothetical protein